MDIKKTLYEKCSPFLVNNVYLIINFDEEEEGYKKLNNHRDKKKQLN